MARFCKRDTMNNGLVDVIRIGLALASLAVLLLAAVVLSQIVLVGAGWYP